MLVKYGKARIVGLITVVVIGLILFVLVSGLFNYANKPKEKLQNTNVKDNGLNLYLKGDYLTYVLVNDEYKDDGALSYWKGQNISDDIITSYYKNGTQISNIDTKSTGSYTVKYEILYDGIYEEITRVVIVTDSKNPSLSVPDAVTITSDEAVNYDVGEGVVATDNTGQVSFKCENTLLSVPGDYIIKCLARDGNGNITKKNRLIKVVSGIEFDYKKQLTIKYPNSKNYTYMYSLDNGDTWLEANSSETLDIKRGNVIALVLEDGEYKMSSTYYIK